MGHVASDIDQIYMTIGRLWRYQGVSTRRQGRVMGDEAYASAALGDLIYGACHGRAFKTVQGMHATLGSRQRQE